MNTYSLFVTLASAMMVSGQYRPAQQGYGSQAPRAAAPAAGPPSNLPGLGQYQAQLKAHQAQTAHHARFFPGGGRSSGQAAAAPGGGISYPQGFGSGSFGGRPSAGVPRYNQQGFPIQYRAQSGAGQYRPQPAAPAPAPQYRAPAPAAPASVSYGNLRSQSYGGSPGPQAQSYGGGQSFGLGQSSGGGAKKPTISHGEALKLHAQAVNSQMQLVGRYIKAYGLDIVAPPAKAGGRPQQQQGYGGGAPANQYRAPAPPPRYQSPPQAPQPQQQYRAPAPQAGGQQGGSYPAYQSFAG